MDLWRNKRCGRIVDLIRRQHILDCADGSDEPSTCGWLHWTVVTNLVSIQSSKLAEQGTFDATTKGAFRGSSAVSRETRFSHIEMFRRLLWWLRRCIRFVPITSLFHHSICFRWRGLCQIQVSSIDVALSGNRYSVLFKVYFAPSCRTLHPGAGLVQRKKWVPQRRRREKLLTQSLCKPWVSSWMPTISKRWSLHLSTRL